MNCTQTAHQLHWPIALHHTAVTGTVTRLVHASAGKYTWSNGAVYDGEYVDNMKQGQGIMTFPDKSKYEGAGFLRCAWQLSCKGNLCQRS
jgi:hypothetical protein